MAHTPMASVEFHQWAEDKKEHAQQLCRRALDFADTMFQSGDLSPYVDILSRLHTYNFYNLLLILQQYPEACCLATFQEWKKQASEPGSQILRNNAIGKGIELIAPFTEPPRSKKRALFWFGVKQFDISQTNLFYPCAKSIYETEARNMEHLERALCHILFTEYHCTVFNRSSEPAFSKSNSPGMRNDHDIFCNMNASPQDRIVWLTQILIELSEPDHLVSPIYGALFSSLALSCLLRIWNMAEFDYLDQNSELIRSVPKNMQSLILDQLQVAVRRYAELIHCAYLEQINAGKIATLKHSHSE